MSNKCLRSLPSLAVSEQTSVKIAKSTIITFSFKINDASLFANYFLWRRARLTVSENVQKGVKS
jgi:hypothetical protein